MRNLCILIGAIFSATPFVLLGLSSWFTKGLAGNWLSNEAIRERYPITIVPPWLCFIAAAVLFLVIVRKMFTKEKE